MGIKTNWLFLAFSWPPIDSDVYPHLPVGFYVDGEDKNEIYFIKLKKNLYVTCQAAGNWFDMLQTGLEDEFYKQKKTDLYLFVRNICIVIWYVDDCCVFSKDKDTIDSLVTIYQIHSRRPMKGVLILILVLMSENIQMEPSLWDHPQLSTNP